MNERRGAWLPGLVLIALGGWFLADAGPYEGGLTLHTNFFFQVAFAATAAVFKEEWLAKRDEVVLKLMTLAFSPLLV